LNVRAKLELIAEPSLYTMKHMMLSVTGILTKNNLIDDQCLCYGILLLNEIYVSGSMLCDIKHEEQLERDKYKK
jgi:hypothetical protein